MSAQLDLRVLLAEFPDDGRQDITRLRVGGADRERSAAIALLLLGESFDALDLLQDPERAFDHFLARGGDLRQGPALAQKDREAELVLELFELLTDPRLRRVQPLGGRGDVQVIFDDCCQVP
jgi:hypothetical protein